MPACTLHLVAVRSSIPHFVSNLQSSPTPPLLVSKVVRWIIVPEYLSVSDLLHPPYPWDLFIISEGTLGLPAGLRQFVKCEWTIKTGIPSRLVNGFHERNDKILHSSEIPPLTGALEKPRVACSSQSLELSADLEAWINTFSKSSGRGPVSMLNLLAFKPNMKSSYLKYGRAFAESIGSRRGGNAKIVGNVIDKEQGWYVLIRPDRLQTTEMNRDEIAVAHYPSIMNFADMLASDDYQEVNHKCRIPALEDTCILCTSEIALEEDMIIVTKPRL